MALTGATMAQPSVFCIFATRWPIEKPFAATRGALGSSPVSREGIFGRKVSPGCCWNRRFTRIDGDLRARSRGGFQVRASVSDSEPSVLKNQIDEVQSMRVSEIKRELTQLAAFKCQQSSSGPQLGRSSLQVSADSGSLGLGVLVNDVGEREPGVEGNRGAAGRIAREENAANRDFETASAHEDQADAGTSTANGSVVILESKRFRRSQLMKQLLQRGLSPVETLESMGQCTPQLFWTVVNILSLNERAPEALLLFEWWKRQPGYEASEQQYTRFISICGHAQMPDQAEKLFNEMVSLDLSPTVATYSSLLQGFAEAGNFNRANEFLVAMRAIGLKPNAITYTGLLHAYGKQGYYDEMAKTFNNMKTYQVTQPECAPTSVTYSSLLQCYAKGGLFTRMEKALKEMMSKDLELDGNAINAMIQGYAQAGSVKDMERIYSLVGPSKVTVRVDTLRLVALAYIRKSYFYQLGTFARYHNRRRVNSGTLIENLLLLSHAANFAMRGLAEEYVRLKDTGFQGDITSFNIRALAFSRMQMLWDLRVTVLEMVEQNSMPDLVTYGAVVDAYVAGGLRSTLSEALAEMSNLDCIAAIHTDDLVFEAFGRGDFQLACEDLIKNAKDVDRKFFTYSNLVGYYLKKLDIQTAPKKKRKSR